MNRSSQRGLTLPELLIALLIFAMISGAAVHALRLSVEGREQLEIADGQIREVQIMRQIVKQDLANVVGRIVRDDFGNPYPAAFLGGKGISFRAPVDGERTLLVFVRRGWTNPDDRAPRSTLQAVEYLIKGDNLVRRVRPYLDDARGQKRNDRILLMKVTDAGIGFFSGAETTSGPEFVDLWPAPSAEAAIPQAIRLTLTTERFGAVEQLFWLGSAN
jgi:general secretion pathway protein J